MREAPPTQRPPSRKPWVAVGLVAAIAGGLSLLWLWPRPAAPPPPPPPPAAAPAPVPAVAPPPVEASRVRALLGAASSAAVFRRCLGEEDPIRRTALTLDNLAEGVVPAKPLACAAPGKPFAPLSRAGRLVLDPASHARFDAFADAVASVDAAALSTAWRELHPILEWTYRALGYPDASLDQVAAKALRRVAAAPVVEGELALVEGKGALFLLADPKLEALGGVEKQLLRMGPRNTRLLQAKARELEAALAATAGAPRAP